MMGQIFLCGPTSGGIAPPSDCLDAASHQLHPAGYIQHSEWADRAQVVATQRQCPSCDLWAIWTPRRADLRVSLWPEACRWSEGCRGESVGERRIGDGGWVPVCRRHAEMMGR